VKKSILLIIFCLIFLIRSKAAAFAQTNPDTLSQEAIKQRLYGLSAGFAIGYTSSLIMLHRAWYKYDERSSFHLFNDLNNWNQMDKAGHFWTAFHQSRIGIDALKWAGLPKKKAIIYGGLLGIVLQTPLEIFDGYSAEYGASISDAAANVAGSAFVVTQQLAWGKVRIMPKFSFHTTSYAPIRLEMFGNSLAEQMLKDYNGQSYWLSFDVSSFLTKESIYPKWLNFAVGYGSAEMIYGDPNQNRIHGYHAYRRFFISPDINLMNINVKSKFLKKTFYVLSAIRIPMPALEFNSKNQVIFHPVYF
jgi:hypothetical protein